LRQIAEKLSQTPFAVNAYQFFKSRSLQVPVSQHNSDALSESGIAKHIRRKPN
jgi:hypothetical protein